jgi:hypothetical protein
MLKETTEPTLADAYFGFLKNLKREQENLLCSVDKFCGAWKSRRNYLRN